MGNQFTAKEGGGVEVIGGSIPSIAPGVSGDLGTAVGKAYQGSGKRTATADGSQPEIGGKYPKGSESNPRGDPDKPAEKPPDVIPTFASTWQPDITEGEGTLGPELQVSGETQSTYEIQPTDQQVQSQIGTSTSSDQTLPIEIYSEVTPTAEGIVTDSQTNLTQEFSSATFDINTTTDDPTSADEGTWCVPQPGFGVVGLTTIEKGMPEGGISVLGAGQVLTTRDVGGAARSGLVVRGANPTARQIVSLQQGGKPGVDPSGGFRAGVGKNPAGPTSQISSAESQKLTSPTQTANISTPGETCVKPGLTGETLSSGTETQVSEWIQDMPPSATESSSSHTSPQGPGVVARTGNKCLTPFSLRTRRPEDTFATGRRSSEEDSSGNFPPGAFPVGYSPHRRTSDDSVERIRSSADEANLSPASIKSHSHGPSPSRIMARGRLDECLDEGSDRLGSSLSSADLNRKLATIAESTPTPNRGVTFNVNNQQPRQGSRSPMKGEGLSKAISMSYLPSSTDPKSHVTSNQSTGDSEVRALDDLAVSGSQRSEVGGERSPRPRTTIFSDIRERVFGGAGGGSVQQLPQLKPVQQVQKEQENQPTYKEQLQSLKSSNQQQGSSASTNAIGGKQDKPGVDSNSDSVAVSTWSETAEGGQDKVDGNTMSKAAFETTRPPGGENQKLQQQQQQQKLQQLQLQKQQQPIQLQQEQQQQKLQQQQLQNLQQQQQQQKGTSLSQQLLQLQVLKQKQLMKQEEQLLDNELQLEEQLKRLQKLKELQNQEQERKQQQLREKKEQEQKRLQETEQDLQQQREQQIQKMKQQQLEQQQQFKLQQQQQMQLKEQQVKEQEQLRQRQQQLMILQQRKEQLIKEQEEVKKQQQKELEEQQKELAEQQKQQQQIHQQKQQEEIEQKLQLQKQQQAAREKQLKDLQQQQQQLHLQQQQQQQQLQLQQQKAKEEHQQRIKQAQQQQARDLQQRQQLEKQEKEQEQLRLQKLQQLQRQKQQLQAAESQSVTAVSTQQIVLQQQPLSQQPLLQQPLSQQPAAAPQQPLPQQQVAAPVAVASKNEQSLSIEQQILKQEEELLAKMAALQQQKELLKQQQKQQEQIHQQQQPMQIKVQSSSVQLGQGQANLGQGQINVGQGQSNIGQGQGNLSQGHHTGPISIQTASTRIQPATESTPVQISTQALSTAAAARPANAAVPMTAAGRTLSPAALLHDLVSSPPVSTPSPQTRFDSSPSTRSFVSPTQDTPTTTPHRSLQITTASVAIGAERGPRAAQIQQQQHLQQQQKLQQEKLLQQQQQQKELEQKRLQQVEQQRLLEQQKELEQKRLQQLEQQRLLEQQKQQQIEQQKRLQEQQRIQREQQQQQQRRLEQQKQQELEKKRLEQLQEQQKQNQLEQQRQQIEQQKQKLELQKQQQLQQQRQQQIEQQKQQLEQQRRLEQQRQQQSEQQKRLQEQQQQLEQEKQQKQQQEQQRQRQLEQQRIQHAEQQKLQLEKQRQQQEIDRQRLELEKERQQLEQQRQKLEKQQQEQKLEEQRLSRQRQERLKQLEQHRLLEQRRQQIQQPNSGAIPRKDEPGPNKSMIELRAEQLAEDQRRRASSKSPARSPGRSPLGGSSPEPGRNQPHSLGFKCAHVVAQLNKKEEDAKHRQPAPTAQANRRAAELLPLLGKSLDSSGMVKRQVTMGDGAKTLNVIEFKPQETTKRSPRLLRKPRPLKKAHTVDVSGLDVDPELARMLKSRKESSSSSDEDMDRDISPSAGAGSRRKSKEGAKGRKESEEIESLAVPVASRIQQMETKVSKPFFSALKERATAYREQQHQHQYSGETSVSSEQEKQMKLANQLAAISDTSVGDRHQLHRRQHLQLLHQQQQFDTSTSQSRNLDYSTATAPAALNLHIPTTYITADSGGETPVTANLQAIQAQPRLVPEGAVGPPRRPQPRPAGSRKVADSDDEFDQMVAINIQQLVEPGAESGSGQQVTVESRSEVSRSSTGHSSTISHDGEAVRMVTQQDKQQQQLLEQQRQQEVEARRAVMLQQQQQQLQQLQQQRQMQQQQEQQRQEQQRRQQQQQQQRSPSLSPRVRRAKDPLREESEEVQDELSKLSMTEKLKLFQQKKRPSLERREGGAGGGRGGHRRQNPSRFQTQPVTTEEVSQAQALSSYSSYSLDSPAWPSQQAAHPGYTTSSSSSYPIDDLPSYMQPSGSRNQPIYRDF